MRCNGCSARDVDDDIQLRDHGSTTGQTSRICDGNCIFAGLHSNQSSARSVMPKPDERTHVMDNDTLRQDLDALSDDALLGMRIRDLGLTIETSPLCHAIERLYAELAARGLAFRPTCYLADEWFCPDKVPVIAIPFCLAHPRLLQLERERLDEVEGGSDASCLQLLRHECGHAINYAYGLYKRTRWRELFGHFSTTYSSAYTYQPYSRNYVVHLGDNYAQSHPDEDFAETFAVWLTPGDEWKTKYADWHALHKLNYVDRIMTRIGNIPPSNTTCEMPYAANRMTSTLASFFDRKQRILGESFPGYYDPALLKLFTDTPAETEPCLRAGQLLRQHRDVLVDCIASWSVQRKYDLNKLLTRLAKRCDKLNLHTRRSEADSLVELTAFINAAVSRRLHFEPGQDNA